MRWKERAAKLKTDIPALWLCLKAKETPLLAKVLAAVTVLVLGCSVSASIGTMILAITILALGLAIFKGDRDLCGRPTGFLYNL